MHGCAAVQRGVFVSHLTVILGLLAVGVALAENYGTRVEQDVSGLDSGPRRSLNQEPEGDGTEEIPKATVMATERIFMGVPAELGEFPYLVSLRRFGTHFCGGVLIKRNLVLTAAHCVDERRPQVISHPDVRIGLLGIDDTAETRPEVEEFEVCSTIVHKEFDFGHLELGWDIALMVLKGESKAATVGLPRELDVEIGTNLTAAGFGRVSNSRGAQTLQKTDKLAYISNEKCSEAWVREFPGNVMCALDPAGSDVCQGDSGGPLVTADRKMILGVVSFGPPDCTNEAIPSVYTRISEFVDFVEELGGENGIKIDNPNCEEVDLKVMGEPPSQPVKDEEDEGDEQNGATDTSAETSAAVVEAIVSKILGGDTSGAADEIAKAVADGNIDAVMEAVRTATEQGARDDAGKALLAALRLGVPARDLLPAFNIVNP